MRKTQQASIPVHAMHPAYPTHLAIIMDGNGRWARARSLPRKTGHRKGVEALRRTVRSCRDLGIAHLTVFSFSTENWQRPRAEIESLFDLLRIYAKRDLEELAQNGVRVRVIGSRRELNAGLIALIDDVEKRTHSNTAFTLNIAFNYGGRAEIAAAARSVALAAMRGELDPNLIDENTLAKHMWARHSPDPDLVIRTGGEIRISNFLLWSAAYAEWVFLDVCWPDFGPDHLETALHAFRQRERRFGHVEA